MTKRYHVDRAGLPRSGCGTDGLSLLRRAEDALNHAISFHGINSGEVFAARWHVNQLRRRVRWSTG